MGSGDYNFYGDKLKMKFITVISMMLVVTIIFFSWGVIVDDLETNYIETNISDSSGVNDSYKSTYNRVEELNNTFYPVQEDFQDISEDDGWFDRIGDASIAIPKVIISIPGVLFTTVNYAISDTVSILKLAGIPAEVVLIASIFITLMILFMIIAFWRRYDQ